jgi:kynureninase
MTTAPGNGPAWAYPDAFRADEAFALDLDARDPLGRCRELFHLPVHPDGRPLVYLCSHSLGLQPRAVRPLLEQELDNWARLGVEAHFKAQTPWYTYEQELRGPTARLVGALPHEVVLMNGLTVNLHLMLETFYRPRAGRACILMEEPTFPSDLYAIKSQLRRQGLDPAAALLTLKPRPGEETLRAEDIADVLDRHGSEIALVLLSGVNFFTGQFFDLPAITAAAKQHGCVVGFDLAHAVGNVPLRLHDWQVDFAVWCTYKYLCGGPGAVAGCFVHEEHGRNVELPRLAGWWGNDPATRFRMQLQPEFVAHPGADGWQVSNPPILALVPLRASLGLFDEIGMPALRRRAECLTAYLQFLLDRLPADRFEVITPRAPAERGCQVSMLVHDRPRELFQALQEAGVVGDFRQPNVVRIAPVPLYNTFHELYLFARTLARHV